MGRRGPKTTPASVKIRKGITAPSDVNLNEPMPSMEPPGDPETPDDPVLAAALERAHYLQREVLRLQHPGLITKLDEGILESYALIRSKREQAADLLARTGMVVRGRRPGELVRNPVAAGWERAVLMELRLGAELGIGPAARASIELPAGEGLDLPDIGPAPRFTAIAGGKP